MNSTEYLERIGLTAANTTPDAAFLKLLQRQHLLNVPFENLDIHWKRPIVLDTDAFYRKIVEEKRGGFCYELNGLFSVLLEKLGYKGRMVSACVSVGEGRFGPEYDHMAIIAEADGEDYLADVGFGAFTAEPLRLTLDIEQEDATGIYRIRKHDEEYLLVEKKDENGWQSEYIFTDNARDLSEYAGMCRFHQTSPESHFTKNKVCSLMTPFGRKTLTNDKFIEITTGGKNETAVGSEDEFNQILKQEFNIEINN